MTANNNSRDLDPKVYDLLSSEGKFIKVGTKREARSEGLYRGTVHILLFDPNGKLLICKRPSSARVYPNLWSSSAGGHIEKGETHEAAAHRELNEELGVRSRLNFVGKGIIEMPERKNVQYVYRGTFQKPAHLCFDENEIAETKLQNINAIKDEININSENFTKEFVVALNLFCKRN